MSSVVNSIKKNYKNILVVVIALLLLPILDVIIKIVYIYGTCFGNYARILAEHFL